MKMLLVVVPDFNPGVVYLDILGGHLVGFGQEVPHDCHKQCDGLRVRRTDSMENSHDVDQSLKRKREIILVIITSITGGRAYLHGLVDVLDVREAADLGEVSAVKLQLTRLLHFMLG